MAYRPAARAAEQTAPAAARGAASPDPVARRISTPPAVPEPFLTLAMHGHGVELSVRVAPLQRVASAILGPLIEPFLPAEPGIRGTVLPFEEPSVLRQLSPEAVRVDEPDLLLELYREPGGGERIWLVDERWGISEINLLRRTFRSWILPGAGIDAVRLFEAAIMWPLAQLMRGAGIHLIPAAAVGRNGKGVLILSPFDVGPELSALAESGVGIVGQRWTALREEPDGRVSVLSVPGRTEQSPAPRLLSSGPMGQAAWVDLAAGRHCHQAYCEMVLLVEPMRRSQASVRTLTASEAREQLKLLWPIPQLSAGASPTVATNLLSTNLSRTCSVLRIRLSRDGQDLARLLVKSPRVAAA